MLQKDRRSLFSQSAGTLLKLVIGIFLIPETLAVPLSNRLDLSYLHTAKASKLLQAVRSTLDREKDVDIDLSSSLLGAHVADLVASLESSSTVTIQLAVRCNQWQPEEATILLQAIVGNETDGVNETNVVQDLEQENGEVSNATTTKVDGSTDDSIEGGFPTVTTLDLGWNDLGQILPGSKSFLKALQNLVASPSKCPQTLRLDICGLGPSACRALGKGIVNRYKNEAVESEEIKPISLHLARNEAIGDAGAAALSAAIRIVNQDKDALVFDILDLSSCGIGDAGAEALAITLESRPGCVRHLDLSNNHISDEGASAIGRALSSKTGRRGIETLDLSNNKDLGDSSASIIAKAIESGMIENLCIRSCHIQADGASAFAKAIKLIGTEKKKVCPVRKIDLSGNPLGILRKKSKPDGGKYSATALKSKASATTAAYINIIGSTVQKGLKDFGVVGPDPAESDDVEDERMNDENESGDQDPSKVKCGALAFATSFIGDGGEGGDHRVEIVEGGIKPTLELGLRRCFLDSRAADALAAVVQDARESLSIDLTIDATMNNVLEDEMINALRGDRSLDSYLGEMAERHLEAMEAFRIARERALQAAEAAAARVKAEARLEAAWGSATEVGDDGDYEEEWDSDADYEDGVDEYEEGEEEYF